jgi:uncharacterized protein
MRFVWDDSKRLTNLRKHKIDFVGIEGLFGGYTITLPDERFAYGEQRFITFGLLNQRVVAVAHTETASVIRIVSIRKAYHHEQEAYFKNSPFSEVSH